MGEKDARLESISRTLDILLRLKIREVRFEDDFEKTQKDMILLLDNLGLTIDEICEYLGAPRNSVAPTLSREKARFKKESR